MFIHSTYVFAHTSLRLQTTHTSHVAKLGTVGHAEGCLDNTKKQITRRIIITMTQKDFFIENGLKIKEKKLRKLFILNYSFLIPFLTFSSQESSFFTFFSSGEYAHTILTAIGVSPNI